MVLENLVGSDPDEPFAARARVLVRCVGFVPAAKEDEEEEEDAGAPRTFECECVVPLFGLSAMVRELWPIIVIRSWRLEWLWNELGV